MTTEPAPVALPLALDAIPDELTRRRQWVAWDYTRKPDGTYTKVPINPDTGRHAATNAPSTWGTFTQAVQRMEADCLAGVGFVLIEHDPYTAFDLDGCRDPATGGLNDFARGIVGEAQSYSEATPSGRGVRILTRGVLASAVKRSEIELYDRGRFVTITGWRLPDTPPDIRPAQDLLNRLHAQHKPPDMARADISLTGDADGAAAWVKAIDPRRAAHLSARLQRVAAGDDAVPKDDGTPYAGESERRKAVLDGLYLAGLTDDEVGAAFMTTARYAALIEDHGESDGWRRLTTQDMPAAKAFIETVRHERDERAREQAATLARQHNLAVDPETGEVLPPPPINPPPTDEAETVPPAPMPRRPLTDLGNAERLIDRFGEKMRYVAERDVWAIYTGTRWTMDTTGAAKRRAYATVRGMYSEASDGESYEDRAALAKHAVRSEAAARVTAMLDLARWLPGIPASLTDFDRDPLLLNCANGVLDLRTGELRLHSPVDLLMKGVPVPYDPDAPCPQFDAFLARIQPDADMRSFMQRAMGYSLTGDTREQQLFVPYGTGSNGKTTLFEAFAALLADYGQQARIETFTAKTHDGGIPNDLARIVGARCITTVESNEYMRLNTGLVKQLTGGDRVTARFLHREFFDFTPVAKFWLVTNHKPLIRDTSHGMWRRVCLIPFAEQIPDGEQDRELPAKLRVELSGILAWAVRGCREWLRGGLNPPQAVRDATNQYRAEMDVFAAFTDECCEIGKNHFVTTAALYAAYKAWCERTGERAETKTAIGKHLREHGYTEGRDRQGGRGWFGLCLLSNEGSQTGF